jgi:hypothetical protein
MDSPPAHATGREPAPPRLRVGRTAEHELSTGHRVVPGRNAELEVAATLADAVLRRLLSTCRMGSAERSNGQASSYSIFSNRFTLMRSGAPPGTRTPNPLIKSAKFTHSGSTTWDFTCPGSAAEASKAPIGPGLMDSSMDKIHHPPAGPASRV